MRNLDRIGFPQNVLEQAEIAAKIKPASYLASRLDLRGKTIFTFAEDANSPTECAYSISRDASGWKLGVHVSDIAEYVCEGSPLDVEACRRGATIENHFENTRMLPNRIVSDICNLSKNSDKLALSIMLEIDSKGKLVSVDIEESVIRVSGTFVYSEIDQLGLTSDASAVMALRVKYEPFIELLLDLYELAAVLCNNRRKRGGLDCTYFRRVYERNSEGKITSFERIAEPDSRAMIREIGYFTGEAVGKHMIKNKLPCIFNGRGAVPEASLDYLSRYVGADESETDPAKRAANIANKAKGEPYYDFVCDALASSVPRANYTTKRSSNSFCGCDHIVSFFTPASHYTDLLIQRVLKESNRARVPGNLNLNRFKKIVSAAAKQANISAEYLHATQRRYRRLSALEYVANNPEKTFRGTAVSKAADGSLTVVLECALYATVPAEFAKDYEIGDKIIHHEFEVIKIGTEDVLTLVKPI